MSAGEVGEAFGLVMPKLPAVIPFVASKYFNPIVERHTVDLVVLHCMQSPETPQRAEWCAQYMATLNELDADGKPIKKSAHYYVDCDSAVQGVHENRIAFHAPGANSNGVGIEHAGQAKQTREDWLDEYGIRMLSLSAQLTARICKRWGIPVQYVPADGLLAGTRGITTHADCTRAWKRSTHFDPGVGFPVDWFIARTKVAYAAGSP